MNVIDTACAWAVTVANDDSHGYDQSGRWGPDYDCSSLVISAFKQALVPLTCTYTGNMKRDMLSHGFADVTGEIDLATGAGLLRGDVLLHETKHTALYIGAGNIVNAGGNEHGGVTGGQTGDQTGREIRVCPYYNFPWECVLRYREDSEIPKPEPEKAGTYTVKQGDSLWGIAERELGNGYRFEELRVLNGLDGYTIYPGQTLRLPAEHDPPQTRSVTLPQSAWSRLEAAAAGRGMTIEKMIEEDYKP